MKFQGLFAPMTDYKTTFSNIVDELVIQRTVSIADRNSIIKNLTDAYVIETNQIPDGRQLERLANWILLEDLTNKSSSKVQNEEFPVLSEDQLVLREEREHVTEEMNRFTNNPQYKPTGKRKAPKKTE